MFAVSLPDHPWLDRLVRGRAWIPVLGILLAGIVATQVEILKLGAAMGQALEQTTTLTNQNEQLRDSVATLGDDQRIERIASSMGMVLPPPGAVGYLSAGPGGNVGGALANIHSPNPSSFVALTPQDGDGAMVTGPGASTLPPLPGAPAPPPAASSSATSNAGATTSGASTDATASGASASATTPNPTTPNPTTPNPTTPNPTTTSGTTTYGSGISSAAPASGTAAQTPGSTSQGATTAGPASAQTSPTTPHTDPSAGTGQSSQLPSSGAAAIQPAGPGQQGGGG